MKSATQTIGALGRPIVLPAGWNYTADGCAISDGRWLIARAYEASAPTRDDEPVQMATGETWDPYEFSCAGWQTNQVTLDVTPLLIHKPANPRRHSIQRHANMKSYTPSEIATARRILARVWLDDSTDRHLVTAQEIADLAAITGDSDAPPLDNALVVLGLLGSYNADGRPTFADFRQWFRVQEWTGQISA